MMATRARVVSMAWVGFFACSPSFGDEECFSDRDCPPAQVCVAHACVPAAGDAGGADVGEGHDDGGPSAEACLVALSPAAVPAGSAALTLTLEGRGFTASSEVVFDGSALPATLQSDARMTLTIPAGRLATSVLIEVSVRSSPGGRSTCAPQIFRVAELPTIVWNDTETKILWAQRFDGQDAPRVITRGLREPRTMDLDPLTGDIYWMEAGAAVIRRVAFDGTGTSTVIPTTVFSGGLALDAAGGWLYWTEVNESLVGTVRRAHLNGAGVEDLVTDLALPVGMVVDPAHGKIYWSEVVGHRVQRANLDGSRVELVATTTGTPMGLALDVAAQELYFAIVEEGAIDRVGVDGTGRVRLTADLTGATDLELDPVHRHLYVTESGTSHRIVRFDLDSATLTPVLTNMGKPWGITMANRLNPAPTLSAITPDRAPVWAAAFVLTLDGTGFFRGSQVRVGGIAFETELISSRILSITMPSSELGTPRITGVRVVNVGPGGGESEPRDLTVWAYAPELRSIDPTEALAGSASVSMTLMGARFVTTSKVFFDGQEVRVEFSSRSELRATIPPSALLVPRTVPVIVSTPEPGGGTSAALSFPVR